MSQEVVEMELLMEIMGFIAERKGRSSCGGQMAGVVGSGGNDRC